MQDVAVQERYTGGVPLHKFILLVEDSEMLAALLIATIKQKTMYLVEHVVDGRSALEVIEHIQPDLLVLDYQLPDINGLELYERIQNRSYYESIPTIFASSDFPETVSLNMKTVRLPKPFSIQQFLDAVHTLLDYD